MDYLAIFIERLFELMEINNVTAKQLGEKVGIAESTISCWKAERNIASLAHALAVADYFNCSLNFLFGRSDKTLDFSPIPLAPFYDRLRKIMADKKISRYRFCIDLKMSNGNFTQWKRGVTPKIQTLIAIANYLEVTLDYLIGREN